MEGQKKCDGRTDIRSLFFIMVKMYPFLSIHDSISCLTCITFSEKAKKFLLEAITFSPMKNRGCITTKSDL